MMSQEHPHEPEPPTPPPHGALRASDWLPLAYDQLRAVARRNLAGQVGASMAPTSLVHAAYLRLAEKADLAWEGRAQFLASAAIAMRHLLVERARRRTRLKHGGAMTRRPEILLESLSLETPGEVVLDIDEAIEALAKHHPRKARLVTLRFFGELTIEECAEALDISPRTSERDWEFARAWLYRHLFS